jgi:hypothetical protein
VPRAADVRALKATTESAFSGQFGRFATTTSVDVKIKTGGTDPSRDQVVIDPSNKRAETNQLGGSTITMSPSDSSLVGAHEVGHLLNLDDKYVDVPGGGSVALPGYENNLMGTGILHGASDLTQQQVRDAITSVIKGDANRGILVRKTPSDSGEGSPYGN